MSANIVNIDKNAFAHVPSISSMDLSNNRISVIHSEAFKEVGNALQHLKMSNALYFTKLPELAFHSLSAMITLDLSDNHIRNVPLDSFHKMSQLKFLYLQVCWYFSNLQYLNLEWRSAWLFEMHFILTVGKQHCAMDYFEELFQSNFDDLSSTFLFSNGWATKLFA